MVKKYENMKESVEEIHYNGIIYLTFILFVEKIIF